MMGTRLDGACPKLTCVIVFEQRRAFSSSWSPGTQQEETHSAVIRYFKNRMIAATTSSGASSGI